MPDLSALKDLIDPGWESGLGTGPQPGYGYQVFPGHAAAPEFDWREAAPAGTDFVSGAFTGSGLASLMGGMTGKVSVGDLFKRLTEHPVYKARESLFDKKLDLSRIKPGESILDRYKDPARNRREGALKKGIDVLTDRIHKLPENKAWWEARQAQDLLKRRDLLGKQRVSDLAKKASWKKAPWHGTDLDKLEGIMDLGVNPGSALDYTPRREWASGYPVQVLLPSAVRGRKIEHNNYYTSGDVARVAKVRVDLTQIMPEYEHLYLDKVKELKRVYPDVKFVVKRK